MSEKSKRGWVLPVVAGIGLLLVVALAIGLGQYLSRPDSVAQTVQPVSTKEAPAGLQPADISSDDGLAQPVRISATVDGTPVDLTGAVSYCDKRGEVVDIQATGPLGGGSRGGAVIVRIAGDTTTTTVLGMSDGELDEGSTWEAAMAASHHGLANLVCIVDINNQQADGPSTKVLGFEPLADKWAAFGWHVQRVDGNDLAAVLAAFDAARALKDPKPRVILFNTLMGKGVPFLEQREKNHFIRVDPPEWTQALEILDRSQPYLQSEGAPA